MRKNRITALSLSCIILSSALYSCGAGDVDYSSYYNSPGGDYRYDYQAAEEYAHEAYDDAEYYDEEITPEYPNADEEYKNFTEQGFKNPETEPLSTFSADVDTASYSNVRRMIEDGMSVPEDAVRVEEFINYFSYDYPQPDDGQTFGEYVEISDCPWNNAHKLMMIGVQGKRLDENELPPSNIVFLIDSSGSMDAYNKLPLVQNAFSMLAEKLTENDRISIITYAGSSRTVISGVRGNEKDKILEALYSITANGSTNGEGGINTAYSLAEEYFIEGGNNRVILATDGDLNVGASSESELKNLIESKRDKGIYLSVLGFGTGNYKDNRLEAVADNGNGNYSYIDSVDEARKVLISEMGGTLFTIAKDVKFQVEFNPAKIKSYRLIGYDNRIMNAEDFYDNTKDAGEVGSGHSVTALYEIELADTDGIYHGIELEFAAEHSQPMNNTADDERQELFKFSTAYKDVNLGEDIYNSKLFGMEKYNSKPSDRISLAASAAEFAMLLKNSEYKGNSDYGQILKALDGISDNNEEISELYSLVKTYYGQQ
ncbi:MAG: VWA domain-containing protein [Ruminococcus sp.]|nr:VWA domain-containing protein [Ruminococcus sp.]